MSDNAQKIDSVTKFLIELERLGEPKPGYTRLYRGHSDQGYPLTPSIYRAPSLLKYEHQMIYDLVASNSDELANLDPFHLLVKLQHYGCPTRLLDLTSNPLVALYFSIFNSGNGKDDKDGKIFCFDIPNKDIRQWDNPEVLVISSFSQIEKEDIFSGNKYGYIIYNLAVVYKSLSETLKLQPSIESIPAKSLLKRAEDGFTKILGEQEFNTLKKEQNIMPSLLDSITRLREITRRYIPGKELNYIDSIDKVLCVRPQANNQRVVNQSGYFFLYGAQLYLGEGNEKLPEIDKEIIQKELIVNKDSKKKIKGELHRLGIHSHFLFPELDSRTQFVKELYNSKNTENN